MTPVKDTMASIAAEIAHMARTCHRDPAAVRLMAVSKTQPDDRIDEALEAGHRLFGENRVQEAQQRWQRRRPFLPDLQLHLIGPLQTNKVLDAVALFDCIQTVDRLKLATALADAMERLHRTIPCMIQVNTRAEAQKAGVAPADLPGLLQACGDLELPVIGLMCIPPQDEPPSLHFALLRKLAVRHGLRELSMGMSADYARAIACGATMIRIGTALFGER